MTLTSTTTTPEHAGAKPCQAGSKTERPCWRPATESDIGETEPTLCTLHMQLRRRAETMDGWLHALEAMRAFRESEPVQDDPHGVLSELAIGWDDEVTEKAAYRRRSWLGRGPTGSRPFAASICRGSGRPSVASWSSPDLYTARRAARLSPFLRGLLLAPSYALTGPLRGLNRGCVAPDRRGCDHDPPRCAGISDRDLVPTTGSRWFSPCLAHRLLS
jgi:hypothetical protein